MPIRAKAVVDATGGRATIKLPSQLKQLPWQAVLGALPTDAPDLEYLDGKRVDAKVSLLDNEEVIFAEQGEVLFRAHALSGIVVFNLSRHALPGMSLSLDMFPEFETSALVSLLHERVNKMPGLNFHSILAGMLSVPLLRAMLNATGIGFNASPGLEQGSKSLSETLTHLAEAMKDFRFPVNGSVNAKYAQVFRGGLATDGFNAETLESRFCSGFFAAGECLDVDGPCGGYNLHWAWASGLQAGTAAAAYARGK